ncbi:hypothetical protein FF38_04071 [Lucilia cuprina]|uniref:Uncharacterized protein n=1 Tax=Lucilia cuprina TaxID=7375 RepID=A0A0L0BRM3_LUCCU|nr:hypothetical protein CVS40_7432 [Lucilia cuprina]KNC22725.1 hypothetical protein FF38_04071 [Lucilia cuprina]
MSQSNKQTSPINKRRSIEELKMQYESSSAVFETPKMSSKPKSPKKLKKSKVKQMASMFNNKMSQLIKRDTEVGKYSTLVNEFSPEAKPQPTATLLKPVPKPRTRLTKPKAPVPSPRTKTLNQNQTKLSVCFVAEEVFAKLSVKDKAKFYTQFVEEMSRKNPQFGKHAQLMEVPNNQNINHSGVIVEKQATVKDLLDELEFNKVFPKPSTNKSHALQRMDSMKRALAARKQLLDKTSTSLKAKEFEDILNKDKPTNEEKVKSLPRIQLENEHLTLEHQQDQTTNTIFQNQQLEDLFFSWFEEKHNKDDGVEDISNRSEVDEEKQKSAIDRLLEEAIAKLEILEIEQNVAATFKRNSFSSTCAKSSETEESESGLSSLAKNTSEESQAESLGTKTENSENDFEFAKPLKPLRKKKLRRNAVFKKEVLQNEINQINSTDSESDSKQTETKAKNKKLFIQPRATEEEKEIQSEEQEVLEDFNESLIRVVNSPRKIKSAYTLTVLETPLCTPRSSLNFAKSHLNRSSHNASQVASDQGFETATNDNESPMKRVYVAAETNSTLSSTLNSSKNNFGYSTPIKEQEHHSFANTKSGSAKQLFSPIAKPMKSRRKSFYDMEARRSSLAMQVIREDQPLEAQETYESQTEQKFFANAPTMDITKETTNNAVEKTSIFWINCGDFSVAWEINYNEAERLRLLYEIFSQTSCETKDLHFGIDDQKFSVHGPYEMDNNSAHIPASKGSSHYWFSTGDLVIPFSGKYLSSQKIQRLFCVIKESVEETGILRFGVDQVEFSNVPEFWYQPAKFSVESQYSMLVGLQSGDSNGLEGRSKNAWPHSKPVMISDLDESDNFEEIERGRLSFSPFGSNHYDLASLDNEELSMPRHSQAMMSLESYCGEYESEPLDQLFEDRQSTSDLSLPEMVYNVENQQQRLSAVQEHFARYVKPCYIPKDSLDCFKGTPEYVEKLKDIVSDISNIGCSNHFKSCSVDELESYMHFLSRYAEICLSSCNKHMDTVLEALVDYKAVVV